MKAKDIQIGMIFMDLDPRHKRRLFEVTGFTRNRANTYPMGDGGSRSKIKQERLVDPKAYMLMVEVWKVYPIGSPESAYVISEEHGSLSDAVAEIGERSIYTAGAKYIIEAALMRKDEYDALGEFDAF